MKKQWFSTFAIITVIILAGFLVQQFISSNRKIAHISKEDQNKAIEISSLFITEKLAKNLQDADYVYVDKIGEHYYTKNKKIKTVRVIYNFKDFVMSVLVDVDNNKVVQVTETRNFEWMKLGLISKEEERKNVIKDTFTIIVIIVIILFFWSLYRKK